MVFACSLLRSSRLCASPCSLLPVQPATSTFPRTSPIPTQGNLCSCEASKSARESPLKRFKKRPFHTQRLLDVCDRQIRYTFQRIQKGALFFAQELPFCPHSTATSLCIPPEFILTFVGTSIAFTALAILFVTASGHYRTFLVGRTSPCRRRPNLARNRWHRSQRVCKRPSQPTEARGALQGKTFYNFIQPIGHCVGSQVWPLC
ncbi:hypothetical protein TRVL_08887 [Trypanosoma vivax]|nr:hypothetical protein TRVL_08887 [Trypanosoma vivax]